VLQIATCVVVAMTLFLSLFATHSVWVTSEAYSSPSIVLSARGGDGGRIIFDDFREAYYWLRHNTPEVSLLIAIGTTNGSFGYVIHIYQKSIGVKADDDLIQRTVKLMETIFATAEAFYLQASNIVRLLLEFGGFLTSVET